MTDVVDTPVNHDEKSYAQRGRQALSQFQQTGKHITLAEFSDWVNKFDTEQETKLPKCHK